MEHGSVRKRSWWGWLVASLLVVVLAAAAAGWWFFGRQGPAQAESPSDTVLVFLLSPVSGAEVRVGDHVPLRAKATAPDAIVSMAFYADGVLLGAVSDTPQEASLVWQPLAAGIHALYARATTDGGGTGQSQTVLVNVLAGEGTLQVRAEEGQTLEQVGAQFGVPAQDMADANPDIDPGSSLPEGFPVQVPAGGGEEAVPPESVPLLIHWSFTPGAGVEKAYCYFSDGSGIWKRMPQEPFAFFGQGPVQYVQADLFPQGEGGMLQAQCWGWLGGMLETLGEGETAFDEAQPPDELVIQGTGFVLVGMPQVTIPLDQAMGGKIAVIPPPFALREPTGTQECASHALPLLGGFVCNTLLNASFKEYIVLVWEWEPKPAFPGDNWVSEIDGYDLYLVDPYTLTESQYLKRVGNPSQKVSAIPLPWGATCFGVRAISNDPAYEASQMSVYCPGQPPGTQVTTVTPTDWLTSGGTWTDVGCGSYGGLEDYLFFNQTLGFGNQAGEVLTGGYVVNDFGCFRQGDNSGAVKFSLPALPPDAVVQEALLGFSKQFSEYQADGVALGPAPLCAASLGTAKQNWTGLDQGQHWSNTNLLASPAYFSPFLSLPAFSSTSELNVTAVVQNWLNHPDKNFGFILTPRAAPQPLNLGAGTCLSGLDNFQLEIHYFTAP